MKQIIYTTVTPDFIPCLQVMADSVRKHNADCEIHVDAVNCERLASEMSLDVVNYVTLGDIDSICSYRVPRLLHSAQEIGDGRLIMLDCDTYCQVDPFEMFANNDEVIQTSRSYTCRYQINAGVQGYQITPRTIAFLAHYAEQLSQKTWEPFIDFQRKFDRDKLNGSTWIEDQDYLCAVYRHCVLNNNEHPSKANIRDAGPWWNWTAAYDNPRHRFYEECRNRILEKVGDSTFKILHFKGSMKPLMPGVGEVEIKSRSKL